MAIKFEIRESVRPEKAKYKYIVYKVYTATGRDVYIQGYETYDEAYQRLKEEQDGREH